MFRLTKLNVSFGVFVVGATAMSNWYYWNRPNSTNVVKNVSAKKLFDCGTGLGECPIWDDERKLLCWIAGDKWSTYDPMTDKISIYNTPERAGSFALCKNTTCTNIYLFSFESGLCFYNPFTCKILYKIFNFNDIDNKIHPTRLNDGKCDKYGNFIVGGLNMLWNIYDKNVSTILLCGRCFILQEPFQIYFKTFYGKYYQFVFSGS
eukprot:266646_1